MYNIMTFLALCGRDPMDKRTGIVQHDHKGHSKDCVAAFKVYKNELGSLSPFHFCRRLWSFGLHGGDLDIRSGRSNCTRLSYNIWSALFRFSINAKDADLSNCS